MEPGCFSACGVGALQVSLFEWVHEGLRHTRGLGFPRRKKNIKIFSSPPQNYSLCFFNNMFSFQELFVLGCFSHI